VPWAGQAMLERHALSDDWKGALAVVEANLARKAITRAEADRQRAVLKTAMAEQLRERDPAEALALAREAIKLAPDLTPASALAGSLLAQKGDLRRAGRILESAWKRAPHPDLARAYVDLRHGDAAGDRLNRAKALGRLAPSNPESQLIIARSALEARQFDLARRTMADLLDNGRRPTVRMCLMMADIEETENGPGGLMREWLSRAARAPRDPAWVADGVVSDRWLPASPVTGQIDAFRWETPVERLANAIDDANPPIWPAPASPLSPAVDVLDVKPTLTTMAGAAAGAGAAAIIIDANEPAQASAAPHASEPVEEKPQDAPPVADAQSGSVLFELVPPPPTEQSPEPIKETTASAPAEPVERPESIETASEPADAKPLALVSESVSPTKKLPPEHILTAPDDPGPDAVAEPPPVPPRKRGFFG
jgi:HemY protein